jgi:thiamine pyrophosphate-dependent acetolactate synthase large subunit-like protein
MPERRVMAVCGDGGFMMNSQEMETAVRLKLNLVILILEDSAYGMIRWKQAVDKFSDFGLTFGNPDFAKYAESYGAAATSFRRSKPHLRAAASISSSCRSITRKTSVSLSTNCARR